MNGEMKVDSGRLIWEFLVRLCLDIHLKCSGQEGRQYENLKKIQENIGRKLVGGSSTVAGVVVRGNLGWRKLEERR